MELSVREWMIIVGALLIVAVLLDGYRRIRNENRHRIKVSLSRQAYRQARSPSPAPAVVEEVGRSGPNPELPNGGARVIGKRAQSLQLDQPVPVLLESVQIPPQVVEPEPVADPAPGFDNDYEQTDSRDEFEQLGSPVAERDDAEAFEPAPQESAPVHFEPEPLFAAHAEGGDSFDSSDQHDADDYSSVSSDDPTPVSEVPPPMTAPEMVMPVIDNRSLSPSGHVVEELADEQVDELAEEESASEQQTSLHERRVGLWEDDEPDAFDEPEDRRAPWHGFSLRRREAHASEQSPADHGEAAEGTREVLSIFVVARNGGSFKGQDLLQLLLACDLRFGKMNIFHRHEKPGGRGAVQFSVANIAEPGTFDLDRMEEVTAPGVCLFLVLPGPEAPYKAFDYMVETAQVLVKHLDGELRDDAHSALTRQTLEHCRQRIRDFERKQLTLHL